MRHMLMPVVKHMKWPMRAGAFFVNFMHHLAAFFAWIWMFLHTGAAFAQAGWQASRLWETRIISDIWGRGFASFQDVGTMGFRKILALACIPAMIIAIRNSYLAYEQFHAWVHRPRAGNPEV